MKRFFALVALFFLLTNSLVLTFSPKKAGAQQTNDFSQFCVIPATKGVVSTLFTLKIIDRAHIEVTYVGQGPCTSPSSLSSDYFDAGTNFASLINGLYVDGEVDDGKLKYDSASGSGISSFIDYFSDNLDDIIIDPFSGRDLKISVSASTFENPEFTPMFFASKAGIDGVCPSGTANVYLGLTAGTGGNSGYSWSCNGNFEPGSGISVAFEPSSIPNFNIVYAYDPTNDEIQHVSAGQQGNRTFIWCPGAGSGGEYRAKDCIKPQNNMAIRTTKAELDAIGAGTKEFTVVDITNPSKTMRVEVAGAENSSAQTDQIGGGVGTDGSCEGVLEFAFNFVLCPLILASNEVISWVDDRIISALSVESAYLENDEIQRSWGNIRNVGYIILIPIMLMMVIGTALGFGFLDAYTVKRAMPRLIVAIIFMALSYDICRIMIEVSNGVGRGIAGIIASPFGGMSELTLNKIFNPGAVSGSVTFGVAGALFAARGAIASNLGDRYAQNLTTAGLLALGITLGLAALFLLVIFAILAFRELAIIFLLIISPLAILSWIFPGNDKFWKLWWNSFTKLLYLFPIIMAAIATGRAFASVIADVGGDAVLNTIIKLVAVVGPYFFIPTAFKMAGGAFANITGMVNDRSKGIFDRSRKKREDLRKKGMESYMHGTAAKGDGKIAGMINRRGLRYAARKDVREQQGFRASFKEDKIQSGIRAGSDHHKQQAGQDATLNRVLGNDSAAAGARLFANGASDEEVLAQLSADGFSPKAGSLVLEDLKYVRGKFGDEVLKHMAVVNEAGAKTSFKNGPAEMLAAIAEASDGDEAVAAALYTAARQKAEAAQRTDLAGYSWNDGFQQIQNIMGSSDPAARETIMQDANKFLLQKGRRGKSSGVIWGSHRTSVENHARSLKVEYDETSEEQAEVHVRLRTATERLGLARASGDEIAIGEAELAIRGAQTEMADVESRRNKLLAQISNMNDQVAYFAPEAVDTVNQIIYQAPIRDADGQVITITDVDAYGAPTIRPKTVQDEVNEARTKGNVDFQSETRALSRQDIEERERLRGGMGPPGVS